MRDATIIRNRDFPIQNHRRQPGTDQRPEGLSEEPRAVIPVAAEQHKLAIARKDGDEPMAVMLDFMQPAVAGGRPFARRNDLEADIARHAGRNRAGRQTDRHRGKNAQIKPRKRVRATDLGQALTAHVRIISWCKSCNHRAEPDIATQVAQHGAGVPRD